MIININIIINLSKVNFIGNIVYIFVKIIKIYFIKNN